MRRLLLLIVGGGLLAGCYAADDSTASSKTITGPRGPARDVSALDCQLNASQCAAIKAGIDFLRASENPTCRNFGNSAGYRYDAPAGSGQGFRPMDQTGNNEMGVEMHQQFGTYSGWAPSNGFIGVMPAFATSAAMTSDRASGGLIAHEEGGHMSGEDGRDHNTGQSWWYQDICTREY